MFIKKQISLFKYKILKIVQNFKIKKQITPSKYKILKIVQNFKIKKINKTNNLI